MSTPNAPTACTAVDADVCIVGAGLSGAYAAHTLLSRGKSVAVLDARHRIGGRLLTAEAQGGGDLGGAWIWPRSEFVMQRVLREMDVPTVPMHLGGETVVRASDGERHVIPDGEAGRYAACGGGAVRVAGGASTIVQKLLQSDEDGLSVHLETRVVRIDHNEDRVQIIGAKSQSGEEDESISISCRAAILAAPPKVLVSTIEFDPPLSQVKEESMRATPTWMEEYGKVSASFPDNWWRGMNLSAISIDQIGAVSTWWEACSGVDDDGTNPTLAGFVTADGARKLQKMTAEAMFDHVIDSLGKLYGVDKAKMGMQTDSVDATTSGSADKDGLVISKGGIAVTYKSWLEDSYTNARVGQSGYPRDYGDKDLKRSVGRLFFAGTETALGHGHMEGAVIAAQRAADEVMAYLG